MKFQKEREAIIATCIEMERRDLTLSTWGNVSMRSGDLILLTPTKVAYDVMKPEDICVIDLEGKQLYGERHPTSEKEVHRNIYNERKDIIWIVHTHSLSAMAVSAMNIQEVPCLVEEMSQLLGGSIPLTKKYVAAEEHEKLGLSAAAVIGDRNCCIMRNHGGVACGRTNEEAMLTAIVMERACKLYLEIGDEKKMMPIPEKFVKSERYRFLYKYGKENT